MMPSRGLHALRGKLPRIHPTASRNLSSISRLSSSRFASPVSSSISRLSSSISRLSSSIPRPTTQFLHSARTAIPSVASVRWASTQQPATDAAPISAPVTDSTSSFSDIDTITIDELAQNAFVDPTALPEQIGYLHAIGIDYGYGPTTIIQWVLEHAHISLDLPWWGAIVLTAASLRLSLMPLYLKMSDSQARMAALEPILRPFRTKMTTEMKNKNTAGALLARQQIGIIQRRAGISTASLFLPMVAQGVLGFCGFRLLKHLATLPVPGLKDGGFLWLQDLTMTDGYLLLPLIMATALHLIQRLGGESGVASAATPGMKKIMLYVMPGMVFLFTTWQPAAVALWFAGSSMIGMPQAFLFQRPAVRKFFGLAPIYRPKPGEEPRNILEEFMNSRNTTTTSSHPSPPPRSPTPHVFEKNLAHMRPRYQSPNIRIAPDPTASKTIDVELVDKSDMVQASSPATGIFEQAKSKFQQARDELKRRSEESAEPTKTSTRARGVKKR